MEDLHIIRKKLENYKKIKQITEAAKLAAVSNFSITSQKLEKLQKIASESLNLMKKISAQIKDEPGVDKNAEKNLLIIIGSQKEIQAHFFSNLKKMIAKQFDIASSLPLDIYCVGKGFDKIVQLEKVSFELVKHSKNLSYKKVGEVTQELSDFIRDHGFEYKRCFVANMSFKSFFIQEPKISIVAPLSEVSGLIKVESSSSDVNYLLEFDPVKMRALIEQKTLTLMFALEVYNAITAENAANFMIMNKAATNSDNLISETTLKKNKIRQILITKQILEITTYVDAE